MVLEEVARGAGLLVERAALLDADRFRHRDLHVVHVPAMPDRLEDPVPEAEDEDVPDRLLAQVVVDPVDLRLAEDLADLPVEADRRRQVAPERLLDDDPPPAPRVLLVVEPDAAELGDDLGERRRLGREVEEAVARGPALAVEVVEADRPARRRARDRRSCRAGSGSAPRTRPTPAVSMGSTRLNSSSDARSSARNASSAVRPPPDPHDRELVREQVRPPQLEERRDHLPVGEVAGGAEQHEGRRVRDPLEAQPFPQRVLERPAGGAALPESGQPQVARRARQPRRPTVRGAPAPSPHRAPRGPRPAARRARSAATAGCVVRHRCPPTRS